MAAVVLKGKPAVRCDKCKKVLFVDDNPATGWYIGEDDKDGDLCPKHNKGGKVYEEI